MKKIIASLFFFVVAIFPSSIFCQESDPAVAVRIVTDEAEAVMNILTKNANGLQLTESDWTGLFNTEGYKRLQKRERSMRRKFEDSTFRAFVLSPALKERYELLKGSLEEWKHMDIAKAARQALMYLPEGTIISAKIYPVIKPLPNSFVFETDSDPAIFIYIDPKIKPGKLFNTLAHELHHIGIGNACQKDDRDSTISKGVLNALRWISGFSEGRAVLAAAGNVQTHPHEVSEASDRAVWERDFANTARDMKELEDFFRRLIDGKIAEKDQMKEGFRFVSRDSIPQGAFYTVGYMMASTVEKVMGRERLVASSCDGYMFMSDYNMAASELNKKGAALPLWSKELLDELSGRIKK